MWGVWEEGRCERGWVQSALQGALLGPKLVAMRCLRPQACAREPHHLLLRLKTEHVSYLSAVERWQNVQFQDSNLQLKRRGKVTITCNLQPIMMRANKLGSTISSNIASVKVLLPRQGG